MLTISPYFLNIWWLNACLLLLIFPYAYASLCPYVNAYVCFCEALWCKTCLLLKCYVNKKNFYEGGKKIVFINLAFAERRMQLIKFSIWCVHMNSHCKMLSLRINTDYQWSQSIMGQKNIKQGAGTLEVQGLLRLKKTLATVEGRVK